MGLIVFIVIFIIIIKSVKKSGSARPNSNPNNQPQQYNPAGQRARNVAPQPQITPIQKPRAYQSSVAQVQQKAAANNNSSIVSRAKANNAKLAEDTTLKELEKEHQHSEHQAQKPVEHSAVCQSQKEELVETPAESLFGSVEDLMIKGYSGNLEFERDFISEATDMLNAFTYGTSYKQ